MSGSTFDDACYVDQEELGSLMSMPTFEDSGMCDTEEYDTDISVVSTIPASKKQDTKNFLGDEIEQTEQNLESLKTKLIYNNEVDLNNVLELIKARPNIDEEIVSQITELEEILKNEGLAEYLKTSAVAAKNQTVQAADVAKKEGTTVKQAIEILRSTLDIFLTACNKSCEEHSLKDDAQKEFEKYKQYQEQIKSCLSDVSERNECVAKGEEHLANCIDLAKKDIEEILGTEARENTEGRLDVFKETKEEIESITKSEMDDVREWLKNSNNDLKIIEDLKNNENRKFPFVVKKYEDDTENLNVKLKMNKKDQESLMKQLKKKSDEEKKLKSTLEKHKNQFEKYEQLHDEFNDIAEKLQKEIRGIESAAKTSAIVIKHIEASSNELLEASIQAELNFQKKLKALEVESKERYLQALMTSAVDKKVHIDYASQKHDVCKQEVKKYEMDLKKNVRAGIQVRAKQSKEYLENYKEELETAKREKEELEESLKKLTDEITEVTEDLKSMGIEGADTLDSLYERRLQEEEQSMADESMLSMT